MNTQLMRTVATHTTRRHIDVAFGFALFRDRRVPVGKKLLALGLGTLGMLLIQFLEIPLEFLTVLFASPIGIEDSVEALVWPLVLACSFLPHLIPPALAETLRAERSV